MEWHGSWSADAPHGKGVMHYANGDAYEGEAQAGRGTSNPNPNPKTYPYPYPYPQP